MAAGLVGAGGDDSCAAHRTASSSVRPGLHPTPHCPPSEPASLTHRPLHSPPAPQDIMPQLPKGNVFAGLAGGEEAKPKRK